MRLRGWRDQRHAGAVFVAQSGVPYSGGGAFAAVAIGKGEWVVSPVPAPVPVYPDGIAPFRAGTWAGTVNVRYGNTSPITA